VVISYGRFGTTYWSHIQGSTLNMGRIGCPETSVRNNYLIVLVGGSLKSLMLKLSLREAAQSHSMCLKTHVDVMNYTTEWSAPDAIS
jgi:hypothetical protein